MLVLLVVLEVVGDDNIGRKERDGRLLLAMLAVLLPTVLPLNAEHVVILLLVVAADHASTTPITAFMNLVIMVVYENKKNTEQNKMKL